MGLQSGIEKAADAAIGRTPLQGPRESGTPKAEHFVIAQGPLTRSRFASAKGIGGGPWHIALHARCDLRVSCCQWSGQVTVGPLRSVDSPPVFQSVG